MMNNYNKLRQLIANVFEVNIEEVNENSSKDSLDNWDSIHQMNLVFALEEEFEIQLSDEDAIQLLNFQLIKIILEDKGVKFLEK